MSKASEKKEKKKMMKLVNDLKRTMYEFEDLKKDIDLKKIELRGSPKRCRKMLEEIKVPPLEILKESK